MAELSASSTLEDGDQPVLAKSVKKRKSRTSNASQPLAFSDIELKEETVTPVAKKRRSRKREVVVKAEIDNNVSSVDISAYEEPSQDLVDNADSHPASDNEESPKRRCVNTSRPYLVQRQMVHNNCRSPACLFRITVNPTRIKKGSVKMSLNQLIYKKLAHNYLEVVVIMLIYKDPQGTVTHVKVQEATKDMLDKGMVEYTVHSDKQMQEVQLSASKLKEEVLLLLTEARSVTSCINRMWKHYHKQFDEVVDVDDTNNFLDEDSHESAPVNQDCARQCDSD